MMKQNAKSVLLFFIPVIDGNKFDHMFPKPWLALFKNKPTT